MPYTEVKLGEMQKCLRCDHEWLPRQKEIVICPKCKSPYWNVPRKKTMEEVDNHGLLASKV